MLLKTTRDQPLFSRPFLAALMVIIPALIWVLNLSHQDTEYPQPQLQHWMTQNQIPVVWLTLPHWQNNPTVEVRILFDQGYADDRLPELTRSTLSLLLQDSLPLRSATINERLRPLATQISFQLNADSSELILRLDSRPEIMANSLTLLQEWLESPEFKARSLVNWQYQQSQRHNPPTVRGLLDRVFATSTHPAYETLQPSQLDAHFQTLKRNVRHIVITGQPADLPYFKQQLEPLTHPLYPNQSNQPVHTLATTNSIQITGQGHVIHSSTGMALQPITNVQAWLSLQLWQAQFRQQFQTTYPDYRLQSQIEITPKRQWLWWHSQPNVPSASVSAPEQTYFSRFLVAQLLAETIQEDEFTPLYDALKTQLVQQTLSQSWWGNLVSTLLHGDPKRVEDWIKHYSRTFNSFTIDHYQEHLPALFLPTSLQEVQVRQ